MSPKKYRVVLMASGAGSNAINILNFASAHGDCLEVPLLVCDRPKAGIVKSMSDLNLNCAVIAYEKKSSNKYENQRQHENKIITCIKEVNPDFIFLVGYMRVLSAHFLESFYNSSWGFAPIVNLHPSLLPAFPGVNGYKDAFDYGVAASGVTLHLVDQGLDSGPIIMQKTFSRHRDDSFQDFMARGKEAEYAIFNEFLHQLCLQAKCLKLTKLAQRHMALLQ